MILRGVNGGARRETSARAATSTKNSKCSDFGFDSIIGSGRLATNHLSNGSDWALRLQFETITSLDKK
jgi:hypothetical protein